MYVLYWRFEFNFLLRFIYFIPCVGVFACIFVCVPLTCTPGVQGGQKRLLDSLELEFWMVLNHHVVQGTDLSPLQEQYVLLTTELCQLSSPKTFTF